MRIDVTAKTTLPIYIESDEAFKILCKTLEMDCVLDEDTDFFVGENSYGENCVYDEHGELFDDRGDLFVALRNVAVNIFPNVGFR